MSVPNIFWTYSVQIQTLQNFNEKKPFNPDWSSAAFHSPFITGTIFIMSCGTVLVCPVQRESAESSLFLVALLTLRSVIHVISQWRQPGNVCHASRLTGWEQSIKTMVKEYYIIIIKWARCLSASQCAAAAFPPYFSIHNPVGNMSRNAKIPEHLRGLWGLTTRHSVQGDAMKIFKEKYSEPDGVFWACCEDTLAKPQKLTLDTWKPGEQQKLART